MDEPSEPDAVPADTSISQVARLLEVIDRLVSDAALLDLSIEYELAATSDDADADDGAWCRDDPSRRHPPVYGPVRSAVHHNA